METVIWIPIMKVSGGRVVEFNPSKEWVDLLIKEQKALVKVKNTSGIDYVELSRRVCAYIDSNYTGNFFTVGFRLREYPVYTRGYCTELMLWLESI